MCDDFDIVILKSYCYIELLLVLLYVYNAYDIWITFH